MTAPTIQTDNFSEAFDKLAELDTPPTPVADPPVGSAPAAPEGEHAPVTEGTEGSPPVGDGGPAGEEAPTGEAPKEDAPKEEPSADALMDRLRTMLSEPAPKPTAPPAPKEEAAPATVELFTADEQAILTKYEEEWPEVVAGQALRERKLAFDVVQHVFNQLAPILRPIIDSTQSIDQREYLGTLQEAVPDYLTIRDDVEAWALSDKQPPYLRSAFEHVIKEGTVDEVVDLIERFRKDTGSAPVTPPPTKKPAGTELPPATKKAVDSLAPVSSKRSVVSSALDPIDFDGAFSKFADDA